RGLLPLRRRLLRPLCGGRAPLRGGRIRRGSHGIPLRPGRPPMTVSDPPHRKERTARQLRLKSPKIIDTDHAGSRTDMTKHAGLEKKKVLIIEDDADVSSILALLLEDMKAQVLTAADGTAGIAAALKQK